MNINLNTKERGFTIVELLIVIVVIGILAAISIVAYNGVQNRAKASSGQNLASQIAKKAELFNTSESSYPTHAVFIANNGGGTANHPAEAKLDNTAAVLSAAPDATTANGGKAVGYVGQQSTGVCIAWWDYAATTPGLKYITVGAGDAGALC